MYTIKRTNNQKMSEVECCICYEIIGAKNNCTTECGHQFCFKCLALSMRQNTDCPMCRAPLIDPEADSIAEVSDDDEEEDDDDEEYDEDDDEYDYSEYKRASPKDLSAKLQTKGVSYDDLVCLLYNRFDSNKSKNNIHELYELTETIMEEADEECHENCMFGKEDTRTIENEKKKEKHNEELENALFANEDIRETVNMDEILESIRIIFDQYYGSEAAATP